MEKNRKLSNFLSHWLIIALVILIPMSNLYAGGLYLQEYFTPSMGTASAGAEAEASDASTALHNPAGMTRIQGNELMGALGVLYIDAAFDRSITTAFPGGNGGGAGEWTPVGGLYYVASLSDELKFGFDAVSVAGAGLDYENSWTGRYQVQDVQIMTLTINPTLAYKLTDELSVAAGLGFTYGELEFELAAPPGGNGKIDLDGNDWETNYNLSMMYELSEETRVGVVYWSETELEFDGDAKFRRIGRTGKVDTTLPLVQFVRGGIYHQLNEKWALVGTVAWEDWSSMDNIFITTSGGATAPLPRNWKDTWHYAAGVHYKPAEKWLLRAGLAYDTSPVGSGDRTADMPIDRQVRYSTGVQYDWSEKLTVGANFQYADFGNGRINSSTLTGDYGRNNLYYIGAFANWKL